MRSGIGLEGEVCQTRQGTEGAFQHDGCSAGTLDSMVGLHGMQVLELRQGSHLLIDFGVVLHCT